MSPLSVVVSQMLLWGVLAVVFLAAWLLDRRIERHNIDKRWRQDVEAWYRGDVSELTIDNTRSDSWRVLDAEGEAIDGGDAA
jgi:hypothetical protein